LGSVVSADLLASRPPSRSIEHWKPSLCDPVHLVCASTNDSLLVMYFVPIPRLGCARRREFLLSIMKKERFVCLSPLFSRMSWANTTMHGITGSAYILPVIPFRIRTVLAGGGSLCTSFNDFLEDEFVEVGENAEDTIEPEASELLRPRLFDPAELSDGAASEACESLCVDGPTPVADPVGDDGVERSARGCGTSQI
jgi:hypothetical protein